MTLITTQFDDEDELEPDDEDVKDYLDDFGEDDLDGLSSDVDRWGDDSFDADRDYLYGLLR